jgi:hypothetical protein
MDNVQWKYVIMNQPVSQTFQRISFLNPLQSITHEGYLLCTHRVKSKHNSSFWSIAALRVEVAATFSHILQSHVAQQMRWKVNGCIMAGCLQWHWQSWYWALPVLLTRLWCTARHLCSSYTLPSLWGEDGSDMKLSVRCAACMVRISPYYLIARLHMVFITMVKWSSCVSSVCNLIIMCWNMVIKVTSSQQVPYKVEERCGLIFKFHNGSVTLSSGTGPYGLEENWEEKELRPGLNQFISGPTAEDLGVLHYLNDNIRTVKRESLLEPQFSFHIPQLHHQSHCEIYCTALAPSYWIACSHTLSYFWDLYTRPYPPFMSFYLKT